MTPAWADCVRFGLIVTPKEATIRARAVRPESMLAKLLAKSVAASDAARAAALRPACPNSPLKSSRQRRPLAANGEAPGSESELMSLSMRPDCWVPPEDGRGRAHA
jgi:hypothetical protein